MNARTQDVLDTLADEIDQIYEELAGSEEEIMFLEAKLKVAAKALEKIVDLDTLEDSPDYRLRYAAHCPRIAEKALEEMGN